MSTSTVTPAVPTPPPPPTAPAPAALGALVVGPPLWAAVSIVQAATREGFDILRHPLSLLSTGDLGWLQIANFVVAGVLASSARPACAGRCAARRAGCGRPAWPAAPGSGSSPPASWSWTPGANFPVGAPADLPLRVLARRRPHGAGTVPSRR